jgi:hypothetical protein
MSMGAKAKKKKTTRELRFCPSKNLGTNGSGDKPVTSRTGEMKRAMRKAARR